MIDSKNVYNRSNKKLIVITICVLAIAGGTYLISTSGMDMISKTTTTNVSKSNNTSMMNMDHSSMNMGGDLKMSMTEIKDDQSFLFEMIPHHQEGVDSSQVILKTTKDADIKAFAEKVILDQNKEIVDMKNWYKELASKDYSTNTTYKAMMGNMNEKTGSDSDKMYVKGMIMHHQMAVSMSNSVLKVNKDSRIKTLAQNIIKNQEAEIITLKGWVMNKFADHSMMMP